jgi:RNA polymerase sigma-70 factor (family 1)
MSSDPNNPHSHFRVPFDNSGYNTLFEDLYVPLCRYCVKITSDKDAAEDIVQDLFVYLWENWNKLSGISSLKAYAYKAVKNRSISYLEKSYRKDGSGKLDNTIEAEISESVFDPGIIAESRELELIIEKALESLPTQCRTIFTMKRFGELSHKEISVSLNISVKTIEAQMSIAIRKLTAFISAHWDLDLIIILCSLSLIF